MGVVVQKGLDNRIDKYHADGIRLWNSGNQMPPYPLLSAYPSYSITGKQSASNFWLCQWTVVITHHQAIHLLASFPFLKHKILDEAFAIGRTETAYFVIKSYTIQRLVYLLSRGIKSPCGPQSPRVMRADRAQIYQRQVPRTCLQEHDIMALHKILLCSTLDMIITVLLQYDFSNHRCLNNKK